MICIDESQPAIMDFESSDYLGSDQSTPDSSYFSWDFDSSGNLMISENSNASITSLNESKTAVSGCRKRKNFAPVKSSRLDDPNFRGVTIVMRNKFVNNEWHFSIDSKFSLSPKKRRKMKTYVDSSEEEEIENNFIPINEVAQHPSRTLTEKHCASCSAKKTPLWRDAEDGTPLCNACGIRYKKYRMRCGTCWHIPKKDEFYPTCRSCGSSYISPRR